MSAGIVHQGVGLACQDRVAGQAEEEVGMAVGPDQGHQLGIGEVAVVAQQTMSLLPVTAQPADPPLHDHGVLGASRTFAGTKDGRHQGAGLGLEQPQGQVAMVAPVRVVVKGQRLLAIGSVVGVVQIQRDGDGSDRVAGDEGSTRARAIR